MKTNKSIEFVKSSPVLKNSIWGLSSNIFQNILLSLFFVIIARNYNTFDFAQFLIANTLYQIVAAFSTLGLGQWFVREYLVTTDKELLISKFLKIQFLSGIFFYLICIIISYFLYEGVLVRELSIILGINVIFDNIIFAIKNLNIAEFEQKKTFIILLLDAILRALIGVAILLFPISIITLCIAIIIVRFGTLNLFIKIGVRNLVSIKTIWKTHVTFKDFKSLIIANWSFIVIGSIAIVYWRIASIVISKMLTASDVANYEISFKIFVLAQLVPLILSSSVFPTLVKLYGETDKREFNLFYKRFFLLYLAFGLISYTFIYSFADILIPLAFGSKYLDTPLYSKEMFLTMIVFPTVFLQANILVAMKLERIDMWLNVIGMLLYLLLGFIGLKFVKSLSVINYSIFISFIIVHLFQDYVLIKKGITTLKHTLSFYIGVTILIIGYVYGSIHINSAVSFICLWLLIVGIIIIKRRNIKTYYSFS